MNANHRWKGWNGAQFRFRVWEGVTQEPCLSGRRWVSRAELREGVLGEKSPSTILALALAKQHLVAGAQGAWE